MRNGTTSKREEIIHALGRYLGVVRVDDRIRGPSRETITRASRREILGYERSVIGRE
jgi:hypothetical protein